MPKLSIIIPVYDVEPYIRACIKSIFNQGLDDNDFELIIVNDGTPDKSMEMITDIIKQHHNITVIEQVNMRLSIARNNGISKAKGEYILMIDSDDLLIENSLPPLLDIALKTKVDLVVANFLEMTSEEITHFKPIKQTEITIKEKTGEELFLEDLNPYECYVWRSLYRKDFIISKKLKFYPGIRYQDIPFTHECYLKAKRCIRTSQILNIYRRRPGSATYSFEIGKIKDFCIAIAETWKLRQFESHTPKTLLKLQNDVYISFTFLVGLISYSINNSTDRFEIINNLKQLAPDLYFVNGIKQRIISFLFHKMPKTYINLNFYGRKLMHILK